MAKKKAKAKSESKEDAEAAPENATPKKQKGISIGSEPKDDTLATMFASPDRVSRRSQRGTIADDKAKGKQPAGFDGNDKGKKPMEVKEKGKRKRKNVGKEAAESSASSSRVLRSAKRGTNLDESTPTNVKITKTSVSRKNVGKEAAETSASSSSRVLRSAKRGTNLGESSVVAEKVQKKPGPKRGRPARAAKKEQPKKVQKNITNKGKTVEETDKLPKKRKTMTKAKGRNDSDEVKAATSTPLRIEEGKPVASNKRKQKGAPSEKKGNAENKKGAGKSKKGESQANVNLRRSPRGHASSDQKTKN